MASSMSVTVEQVGQRDDATAARIEQAPTGLTVLPDPFDAAFISGQSAPANDSSVEQSGAGDTALVSQTGQADLSLIVQSGLDDLAEVTQQGIGDRATITQRGVGNIAIVRQ